MKKLKDALERSASLTHFTTEIQAGSSILVEGLSPASKAFLIALAQEKSKKSILVITGAGPEEFKLFNDIPFFSQEKIVELPAWETLPSENIAPSPDIVGSRITALSTIASEQNPVIVLSSLQGCLQKTLSRKSIHSQKLSLSIGQKISFTSLVEKLQTMGYERKSLAVDKGEFAVRGGIIDLFPVTNSEPFRIEFWGDEIESIRVYDPTSQKSQRKEQKIEISSGKELELMLKEDKLETIFDYLGKNTLVILDDLEALEDRYASLTALQGAPSSTFLGIQDLFVELQKLQMIFFTVKPLEQLTEVHLLEHTKFYSQSAKPHAISFEMFEKDLKAKRWQHPFESVEDLLQREIGIDFIPAGDDILSYVAQLQNKIYTYFISPSDAEEASFHKKLTSHGISLQAQSHMLTGYLSSAIFCKDIDLLLFPTTELTHRYKVKRERMRTYYHVSPVDTFDIAPNELVVHYNHGIGKFIGIKSSPTTKALNKNFS